MKLGFILVCFVVSHFRSERT